MTGHWIQGKVFFVSVCDHRGHVFGCGATVVDTMKLNGALRVQLQLDARTCPQGCGFLYPIRVWSCSIARRSFRVTTIEANR